MRRIEFWDPVVVMMEDIREKLTELRRWDYGMHLQEECQLQGREY
jgi:hypothetical protein